MLQVACYQHSLRLIYYTPKNVSASWRVPLQSLLPSHCSNCLAWLVHMNQFHQFDSGLHTQAKYSKALDAAPPAAPQRAVYFANRAAAALKLQQVGVPISRLMLKAHHIKIRTLNPPSSNLTAALSTMTGRHLLRHSALA